MWKLTSSIAGWSPRMESGGSNRVKPISARMAPAPRIIRLPRGTMRALGVEARDSMAAIRPPPMLAPRISTAPSSTGTIPRAASATNNRIAATEEWNSQVMMAATIKAVIGSLAR